MPCAVRGLVRARAPSNIVFSALTLLVEAFSVGFNSNCGFQIIQCLANDFREEGSFQIPPELSNGWAHFYDQHHDPTPLRGLQCDRNTPSCQRRFTSCGTMAADFAASAAARSRSDYAG